MKIVPTVGMGMVLMEYPPHPRPAPPIPAPPRLIKIFLLFYFTIKPKYENDFSLIKKKPKKENEFIL